MCTKWDDIKILGCPTLIKKRVQELPGCVDVPNSVPTAAVVHATVISGATGATLASRDLGYRSASCPLTWVEPSPTVPHRRN